MMGKRCCKINTNTLPPPSFPDKWEERKKEEIINRKRRRGKGGGRNRLTFSSPSYWVSSLSPLQELPPLAPNGQSFGKSFSKFFGWKSWSIFDCSFPVNHFHPLLHFLLILHSANDNLMLFLAFPPLSINALFSHGTLGKTRVVLCIFL